MLPKTIEGTFDEPKVNEVILAVGEQAVLGQIRFELINLAALMSVGGNLSTIQAKFIAGQLIHQFPNETLGDFKLCFQRGSMGLYGDIQRMDGITIGGWMQKYLDEKYQILEDKLMKEKDHPYVPTGADKIGHAPIKNGMPAPPEVAQKYIDEMKEKLANRVNVVGMSDEEIKAQGREKPPKKKATSYIPEPEKWSPRTLEMSYRQQIKNMYGELPEDKILEILNELNKK